MYTPKITTTLALSAAVSAIWSASGHALQPGRTGSDVQLQTGTIVGTNGADTINGTAGNDVIASLGGNDLVRGLGGDDTVCLGNGRDIVKGGAGDDTFASEATTDGSDNFVGDAGLDRVSYFTRTVAVDVSIDTDATTEGRGTRQGAAVRGSHHRQSGRRPADRQ